MALLKIYIGTNIIIYWSSQNTLPKHFTSIDQIRDDFKAYIYYIQKTLPENIIIYIN
jgi:hypothetical protein